MKTQTEEQKKRCGKKINRGFKICCFCNKKHKVFSYSKIDEMNKKITLYSEHSCPELKGVSEDNKRIQEIIRK